LFRGGNTYKSVHPPIDMFNAYPLLRSLPTTPFAPVRYLLRHVALRALRRAPDHAPGHAAFAAAHREIVAAFLDGYKIGLESHDATAAAARLDATLLALRGFAYEGASMAFALLDAIRPCRPTRVARFSTTVANTHQYMVYVGAGWATARLWRAPDRARVGLDPLLGWLAVDGYGFHEGYFRPSRVIRACRRPRRAMGYATRAFDQGVGRSLWFVDGANPDQIARSITRFAPERRADLWSGVGLAATYAGGATVNQLRLLKIHAGCYTPELAQGAAFAAEARARAQNLTVHTTAACEVFTMRSAHEAARLVRARRDGVVDVDGTPAYEAWRQRVAEALV
jgi:hypothetical protein